MTVVHFQQNADGAANQLQCAGHKQKSQRASSLNPREQPFSEGLFLPAAPSGCRVWSSPITTPRVSEARLLEAAVSEPINANGKEGTAQLFPHHNAQASYAPPKRKRHRPWKISLGDPCVLHPDNAQLHAENGRKERKPRDTRTQMILKSPIVVHFNPLCHASSTAHQKEAGLGNDAL